MFVGKAQMYNVFYSTTSDSAEFERIEVLKSVCHQIKIAKSRSIEVLHWRGDVGSGLAATSGQEVIDEKIDLKYDIYLGTLGSKFGAGTVHEYEKAIKSHIQKWKPAEVIFGFDTSPINPFTIPDDFQKVKEFKKAIDNPSAYGRALLYFEFSSTEEFRAKVFLSLSQAVDKLDQRIKGGMHIV
jgi:hypothetical protein